MRRVARDECLFFRRRRDAARREVRDAEVVDLVLLVRHFRRVRKHGRLDGRYFALFLRQAPIPGACRDLRRDVPELPDVLLHVPRGVPQALVDKVVDLVPELEGHE